MICLSLLCDSNVEINFEILIQMSHTSFMIKQATLNALSLIFTLHSLSFHKQCLSQNFNKLHELFRVLSMNNYSDLVYEIANEIHFDFNLPPLSFTLPLPELARIVGTISRNFSC
jgi:hypothetical protein